MTMPLTLLVLGGGAREHALAWKLSQSPLCGRILVAPGNSGTAGFAENITLDPCNAFDVRMLCFANQVDMVISGPEAPLIAGVVDELRASGIRIVGPTKALAQMEGSKAFAKRICLAAGVQTPPYRHFTCCDLAIAYVRRSNPKTLVIKRDDPAFGKGVVLPDTQDDAEEAIYRFFRDQESLYGLAKKPGIVIEERLYGEEISFFALCKGRQAISFGLVRDYKRLKNGDEGPNTGGMGAYSPVPFVSPNVERRILETVILPTLRVLETHGLSYEGILYAGLIETEKGLFLLEYNVRLGDPETQILMARLSSDLLPFFLWMCGDEPIPKKPEWRPKSAVGIVLASCNYPQGVGLLSTPIEGVGGVETDDIFVFHGAASYDKKGRLYGTGGRVLTVVGLGATHEESRQYAYGALRKMSWPHGHYREDIGILKIRDSSDAEDIY